MAEQANDEGKSKETDDLCYKYWIGISLTKLAWFLAKKARVEAQVKTQEADALHRYSEECNGERNGPKCL